MQCISALTTLGLVVIAILIVLGVIPAKDGMKAIGNVLLAVVLLSVAICVLGPVLVAALTAVIQLLKAAILWLTVAVFVVAVVMLLLRTRLGTFSGPPKRKNSN